jgi:hypothetical protein
MFVVALDPTERGESAAVVLAESLRLSRLEARTRVQAAAESASVVARFAAWEPAEACASLLRAEGLACMVIAVDRLENDGRRLDVTRFTLGDDAVLVERANQAPSTLAVPYTGVRALVRATRLAPGSTAEVTNVRKLSLPRAILTGGLVMTRVEKRVRQVNRGEPQGLLFLYSADRPTLRFVERNVSYRGLREPLSPQGAENFERLCALLRERCPGAVYDDRLTDRMFQAAILGPALTPERHLDLTLALLQRGSRLQGKLPAPA